MRIGSLFSGAGGLDMAVEQVFGGHTVWHCENDAAASKVLAARWPSVPNLGDITKVDWRHGGACLRGDDVCPSLAVDILCGGWPCQPWSAAGKRKGAEDGRALWPEVARAVRALRPRLVVLENVADVTFLGELGRAVGDLAALGYDTQWVCVRASDAGAPHQRERLFALAADTSNHRSARRPQPNLTPPALPTPQRHNDHRPPLARGDRLTLFPTPTARDWKGGTNPLGRRPRADNGRIRGEGDYSVADAIATLPGGHWGKYEPAIQLWETILDRPAPIPGEPNRNGRPRVRPAFSEWLMGWPAGWVTVVDGISRNDQLRIIGNGVVPQQAEAAIRWLLNVSEAVA